MSLLTIKSNTGGARLFDITLQLFPNMEFMMTLNEYKSLDVSIETSTSQDDEYSIPLCMDDIISICKDFNSLGWQIQKQVENILEYGVEDSLKSGNVKQQSLPPIKYFLHRIISNPYFGDAACQAKDCLLLIRQYEEKHQVKYISNSN